MIMYNTSVGDVCLLVQCYLTRLSCLRAHDILLSNIILTWTSDMQPQGCQLSGLDYKPLTSWLLCQHSNHQYEHWCYTECFCHDTEIVSVGQFKIKGSTIGGSLYERVQTFCCVNILINQQFEVSDRFFVSLSIPLLSVISRLVSIDLPGGPTNVCTTVVIWCPGTCVSLCQQLYLVSVTLIGSWTFIKHACNEYSHLISFIFYKIVNRFMNIFESSQNRWWCREYRKEIYLKKSC